MEDRALVIGASVGNIGQAIEEVLGSYMETDGISIQGHHDIPLSPDLAGYRHLVVSCGFMDIAPFDEMGPNALIRIIDANLTVPLAIIQNFLKATTRPQPAPECCVIVIGSYAHDHILSNSVPYCAAKAGIDHAIKCLAWDYTAKGYRFHVVHPHSVQGTPMTEKVLQQMSRTKQMTTSEALSYWERTKLLPNRLTKGEVADTVKWLLLDAPTSHLSGSSVELYGGER